MEYSKDESLTPTENLRGKKWWIVFESSQVSSLRNLSCKEGSRKLDIRTTCWKTHSRDFEKSLSWAAQKSDCPLHLL
ncbi:hypothetical protein HNY73_010250 [Argiope bruennichi]|uniref:Uncharacterized protein n=1 Tax=Argiope bruennichi TaxID=94029 RepID=A0A8T0F0D7_ARGBR|nr:hypothetical protein HNY73_010250 [Argiope bruennichi]